MNSHHDDIEQFSDLAWVTMMRTYSRPKIDGTRENWEEVVDRVIRGNTRKVHVSDKERAELRRLMLARKALPAGRGLWYSGSESHEGMGGTALNNPLHEDTLVLTREHGWVPIKTLEGQTVTLLSSSRLYARDKGPSNSIWVTGHISSAELHPCKKITYQDKFGASHSVVASLNHRWFRKNNSWTDWKRVSTEELSVGDVLPRIRPSRNYDPSHVGIQHGFFFGDGCRSNGTLKQFGEKNIALLRRLFTNTIPGEPTSNGVSCEVVHGCPAAWGYIPEGIYRKDKKYLYGFLVGYFAADGYIHVTNGTVSICSSRKEELIQISDMFMELGMECNPITLDSTSSNFKEDRELYRLVINRHDLQEDFFLHPDQRAVWLQSLTKKQRTERLTITNIEDVDGLQRVLCATVPHYEQFVIEGFCLTSNCWFRTGDNWRNYVVAADLLMLGGGVGFSVEKDFISQLPRIKKGVRIEHRLTKDADFIVPDSRQGWLKLIEKTLLCFFETGKSFTYSTVCVRPRGTPIKGFGGTASGPDPLIRCIENISAILAPREGHRIDSVEAADVLCAIGEMVVSGNVRRSALIILGDCWDKKYLSCKRFSTGYPPYRGMANWSVVCDDVDDLHPAYWTTYRDGEAFGLVNRKNIQNFARIGHRKKDVAVGVNPCQPAWATVLTPMGIRQMGDIAIGDLIWGRDCWVKVINKTHTGTKDVYRYQTRAGVFAGTENHRVVSRGEKIEAGQSDSIDICLGKIPNTIDHDPQDVMDGLVIGDGTVHKASNDLVLLMVGEKDQSYFDSEIGSLIKRHRPGIKDKSYEVVTTVTAEEVPLTWARQIPSRFRFGSAARVAGFLRGLYSANGSVVANRVTLKASSLNVIHQVQEMLSSLGIASYYTSNKSHEVQFGNGTYECRASYDLNIGTASGRAIFERVIGFIQPYKNQRLSEITTKGGFSKITYEITEKVFVNAEPVFDITVDHPEHTYWTGGLLVSNCGEATLDKDPCNLFEVILTNTKDEAEFEQAVRLGVRYAKRVTCEDYHWEDINEAVHRYRRIGISISGCLQSPLFRPDVLDRMYEAIQDEDRKYSAELGVPESIRTTLIKPSGTMSLITSTKKSPVSPGIHPLLSQYMIRRVTFASNHPTIPILREAGYHIEPRINMDGSIDPYSMIVDFYVAGPDDGKYSDRGYDTWKQLDDVLMAMRHWADQSVSVTVYYDRDKDIPQIKKWLSEHLDQLKTISFLPLYDSGFKQMPIEPITRERYEELVARLKPIDHARIVIPDGDIVTDQECAGGACPIR